MRIVFLGNHTVGVRALEALSAEADIAGVVAHPADPEDGVRYRSVHDYAHDMGWRTVRMAGKDPALTSFVAECDPDLIWVTDYRYLLPENLLSIAPLGAVNMHPGLLPRYRGRASINWAILNGEERIGLTVHYIDAGVDSGDVILQESVALGPDQDVGHALELLYPLYETMARRVARMFADGNVPGFPQDESMATVFPRRRQEDGLISWAQPTRSVFNLVRAVADPYPGAFSFCKGSRVNIWKAALSDRGGTQAAPGTVLAVDPHGLHVMCGDGVLSATKWDAEGEMPRVGDMLGGDDAVA